MPTSHHTTPQREYGSASRVLSSVGVTTTSTHEDPSLAPSTSTSVDVGARMKHADDVVSLCIATRTILDGLQQLFARLDEELHPRYFGDRDAASDVCGTAHVPDVLLNQDILHALLRVCVRRERVWMEARRKTALIFETLVAMHVEEVVGEVLLYGELRSALVEDAELCHMELDEYHADIHSESSLDDANMDSIHLLRLLVEAHGYHETCAVAGRVLRSLLMSEVVLHAYLHIVACGPDDVGSGVADDAGMNHLQHEQQQQQLLPFGSSAIAHLAQSSMAAQVVVCVECWRSVRALLLEGPDEAVDDVLRTYHIHLISLLSREMRTGSCITQRLVLAIMIDVLEWPTNSSSSAAFAGSPAVLCSLIHLAGAPLASLGPDATPLLQRGLKAVLSVAVLSIPTRYLLCANATFLSHLLHPTTKEEEKMKMAPMLRKEGVSYDGLIHVLRSLQLPTAAECGAYGLQPLG